MSSAPVPSDTATSSDMSALKAVRTRVEELAAIVSGAIPAMASSATSASSGALSNVYNGVRLVAVSKTKPVEVLMRAYNAGQRHFGENYVQELTAKAKEMPADISWHFIGQLQSNKAKSLVQEVPGLWAVESVDSEKLANLLEKGCVASGRTIPLRVYVQVNTSGEPQKGGVEPACGESVALCKHILEACPHLQLSGLMTIGKYDEVASIFFDRLRAERAVVAGALGWDESKLELSMGMSADYEMAIEHGSTNVRVGSVIFGAREYKLKDDSTDSASSTDAAPLR